MFKKYELIGAGISILAMVTALYLVQVQSSLTISTETNQLASVGNNETVVVRDGEDETIARTSALYEAIDSSGNLKNMVIDDIKVGSGAAVVAGDVVSVHYIGTLQDGTEFDNSNKRGIPFEFTVGGGQVIKGWDEGLLGMQVGGQRILVIPAEMAYGDKGIGPIPPGATLVFSIELLEIK